MSTWKGSTDLVEAPNSPKYEYGEIVTRTHIFRGTYEDCIAGALARGTVGADSYAGYVVARSVVEREKPGGVLTITWQAGGLAGGGGSSGATLPPDQISIDPIELNPALEKHSRYSTLTAANLDAIDKILNHSSDAATLEAALPELGTELLDKRRHAVTNFYQAGFRYAWTQALWAIATDVDPGGYIDTPAGPMTDALPTGLAWLRQADDVKFTGSHFLYTVSWIGAPTAHWDADLYTA